MAITGKRILFTVIPASGHLNPTVPLARAVQERGHEVRVGTAASFAEAVRAAGLEAIPLGRDLDGREYAAANPDFLKLLPQEQARWLIGSTAAPLADGLVELARSWRPDVIVRDTASLGAWVAGEELGIPVVVLGFAGVMPKPAVQIMFGEQLATLRAHRGLAPSPGLEGINGAIYLDTTPPSLAGPVDALVEGRHPLRPDLWVGAADARIPAWLEPLGKRPLVYITLGTAVNSSTLVFQKVIETVTGMDVDAVVTTGRDDADLGAVPSNVHVAGYIPQDRVLGKASAVICHAGRGTVYGALARGLPLCLIPIGADQPVVAAACDRAGVGIVCATTTTSMGPMSLPLAVPADLDPRSIRTALERLLSDAQLRQRARQVAAEIAAMPSPAEVAGLVEAVAAGSTGQLGSTIPRHDSLRPRSEVQ